MKFICAQPRLLYYAWQVEVMINNFIKNGINSEDIIILLGYNDKETVQTPGAIAFKKLQNHFPSVKFFNYRDNRLDFCYSSSLRPHILKQHFYKYPELSKEVIFYHDCDMIFTQPIDFNNLANDNVWYMSNTISYIGAKYITSKGRDLYNKMCDIVGIDKNIPILNENESGGAQYIMKNVNWVFWEKVEVDSEKLYEFFLKDEIKHQKEENQDYHPIQKFTADMWALLWNAWKFEYPTKISEELNFGWAVDMKEWWGKRKIYHNAGVISENNDKQFYKGDYIFKLPYYEDKEYDQKYNSYNYYLEVKETAKKSCLI